MEYLPCYEIEPQQPATASIIWLHGLGADGHDFVSIVPELGLPADLPVRFVFPHAPRMKVTINNGLEMPAWYDILDMAIDRKVDTEQLIVSANAIAALIDREIERGVDSKRIIIAGFSQGGAVAYHSALSYEKPLAGVLALSTYFATKDVIKLAKENAQIPMMIGHGMDDSVVPEELGQAARDTLTSLGYKPDYRMYPIEHGVSQEEVLDIGEWLRRVLGLGW